MRAHSYADPVVGAAKLILNSPDSEIEPLLKLAADGQATTEFKNSVLPWAWAHHRGLVIHEWAHILQVAAYPYLFLRAARAARLLSGPGTFLQHQPGTYPLPLTGMQLDPEWELSHLIGTWPVRLTFGADSIETRSVPQGSLRRGVISEHDLVEEDATIFQFRAEIGARGTGLAYRNWLHETRGYSRIFSILSRQCGDDAALNMIPMLSRIAFHTTRPMLAFSQTLARILGANLDLSDSDDIPFYESILFDLLLEKLGIADEQSLLIATPELDDPEGVITTEGFDAIIARGRQLPVWPLASESRRQGPEGSSAILEILRAPWETFERRNRELPASMLPYLPPVFMVRPEHPDFRHGWTVLFIAPLMVKTPFFDIPDVTYADWVTEVFRARELWKPIMEGTAVPNPHCPHVGCRVHRTTFCCGWISIPRTEQECSIHDFIRLTTGHRVADDGSALIPIA